MTRLLTHTLCNLIGLFCGVQATPSIRAIEVANAMVQDGTTNTEVAAMSQLGAGASNSERNIHRFARRSYHFRARLYFVGF